MALPAQLGRERVVVAVAITVAVEHAVHVRELGGGEPDVRRRVRRHRAQGRLGPAQLQERAGQHGLSCSVAGDPDFDRQATGRVSPDLHRADRGARPGGDQPQAGRVHPGDPAGGQPGDPVRAARGVQQPPGQRGRQQVRRPRQPHRLRAGDLGEQVGPVIPQVGDPAVGIGVALRYPRHVWPAHVVGPPVGRRAVPDVLVGGAVQQQAHVVQVGEFWQAEVHRALGVPLVRHAARGQDAGLQGRRADRGGRHRERREHRGERAEQGGSGRHDRPSPPRAPAHSNQTTSGTAPGVPKRPSRKVPIRTARKDSARGGGP